MTRTRWIAMAVAIELLAAVVVLVRNPGLALDVYVSTYCWLDRTFPMEGTMIEACAAGRR